MLIKIDKCDANHKHKIAPRFAITEIQGTHPPIIMSGTPKTGSSAVPLYCISPSSELHAVMQNLADALKPGAVWYVSFK